MWNSRCVVVLSLCLCLCLGCADKKEGAGALTVVSSPSGEQSGRLKATIRFSEQMVKGEQIGASPVFELEFDPKIEGEAKWIDEQTLLFTSEKNLPKSTAYKVRVRSGIRSLSGATLGDDLLFEFNTERLGGNIEIVGSNLRASSQPVVRLVFNQPVPVDQIYKSCSFNSASDTIRIQLEIAEESQTQISESYRIVPQKSLSLDTEWKVICNDGLRGAQGNMGLAEPLEMTFNTYGPLEYVNHTPAGYDIVPEEETRLQIAFTNPLKTPYKMKIDPPVKGFPGRCHSLGQDPAGLDCGVVLEPRTHYEITVHKKQKDVFDQSLGETKLIQFATSDSEPTISMQDGYIVAELTRPELPVWTRNVAKLDITVVHITPDNFHQLRPLLDWWDYDPVDFAKTDLNPKSKALTVNGEKNKWKQVPLQPAELLPVKPGPGMYYFEVGSTEVSKGVFEKGGRKKVLVNFTDIGVVSKLSPTRGLVWVTKLGAGDPLPGANVSVRNSQGKVTWRGVTNTEGIAILPGKAELLGKKKNKAKAKAGSGDGDSQQELEEEEYESSVDIFVQSGNDWTMVNGLRTGGLSVYNFNVGKDYSTAEVKLRGFMHTDRGLYRPGDKIHVKGLARETSLGEPLRVPRDRQVKIEVLDPRGKVFAQTEATLSRFGGFWFDVELPEDARLGDYFLNAVLENGMFSRHFSVEKYRPATFEVNGGSNKKRIVRKGSAEAHISADYFYGAPLRNGDVTFTVHSRPRTVSFPEYKGFVFRDTREYEDYHSSFHSQQLLSEEVASLDDTGKAAVSFSVSHDDVPTDADLLIRASVTSPGNRTVNKVITVPYFRSRRYFGIKSSGYFFEINKPQKLEIIGVSPSGKPADERALVTVTRREWNCVWEDWGYRGSYKCDEKKLMILSKTVELAGGKPAEIEFTPELSGEYLVVVEGEKDYQAAAARTFYAYGGGGYWRSDDSMTFDILADKEEYRVGDRAILILKTDLAKAKGLLTIERDGVIETRQIEITPESKFLEVPIEDYFAPNVYVSVALVQGRLGPGKRGKPRMRMGLINLPVRPDGNRLDVAIETDKKDYLPGESVTATIQVRDSNNRPVMSEASIVAADEGVLSLVDFKTPDPIPDFYLPWGIGVDTATQFAYIQDIPGPNLERPATGGDSGGPGSVRSRFMATAVWKPGVLTNSEGTAKIEFEAPDNLTAFRTMAVVADKGYRFGSADVRFTVSKPLQLHPALPRFLSMGDKLKGGVVVHNETGREGVATVELEVNDKLTIEGPRSKSVTVVKGGRQFVPFDIEARVPGEGVLTGKVEMNGHKDGVELKLPVFHPSPPKEVLLAYGSSVEDIEVPIKVPAGAIPSSVELDVSIDPHGLAGIEDGLRDLIGYPYGCLEQTTSKLIPMLTVRGLAEALNLQGLSGDKLDSFIKAGIAKIGRHQTHDGGFSLWPGGDSEAYYTAYALLGLYHAQKNGYKVDNSRIEDGLRYFRDRARSGTGDAQKPYYSRAGQLGVKTFTLYIRAILGDKDTETATRMFAEREQLPVFGKAFLAMALAEDLGKGDDMVKSIVQELDLAATMAVSKKSLIDEPEQKALSWYMSDSLRTTAIVLDALLSLDPENKNISLLVPIIMKKRRSSPYLNTQANLYSLIALVNYVRGRAQEPPAVKVAIAGEKMISGRFESGELIKMATRSISDGDKSLLIQPEGQVFYSVRLRYRPMLETVKAAANGFSLSREYGDEDGEPITSFRVGDIVRIKLKIPLEQSVNHLMISDHLPAGFEALNTRLATEQVVGEVEGEDFSYWRDFREIHDERVDFSSEYRWRGLYEQTYQVRAIAEGRFIVPPAVAELMYEPETNSQTDLKYIEIGPKE